MMATCTGDDDDARSAIAIKQALLHRHTLLMQSCRKLDIGHGRIADELQPTNTCTYAGPVLTAAAGKRSKVRVRQFYGQKSSLPKGGSSRKEAGSLLSLLNGDIILAPRRLCPNSLLLHPVATHRQESRHASRVLQSA